MKTERPTAHWNQLNESELTGGMKSIVLDGERIAESIQKTRDKIINGEYDNNDLILRSDALKAIRQKCISEHLPFKSNTPEGKRVLEALVAVHQVKPYKEVCCGWISVKDRLPDSGGDYLVYFIPDIFWERTPTLLNGYVDIKQFDILRKEFYDSKCYLGESITHWMPLPNPPEETANDSI